MKYIVLEIRDKKVVLLSDDGTITIAKNQNYLIGQEFFETNSSPNRIISFRKEQIMKIKGKIIAVSSAVAVLIAFVSLGAYSYYTPYSYVSLDVNPSIAYAINRFDRVIHVSGVNDDGTEILTNINLEQLRFKDINTAIEETINEIADEGYLSTDDSGMMITTASENDEKALELAETLTASVTKKMDIDGITTELRVEAVGYERVLEARELGVTPGKLNLVEKLIEASEDESVDQREWLQKSVKDIMVKTKEAKERNKINQSDDSEQSENAEHEQEENTEQEKNQSETIKNKEENANKKQNKKSSTDSKDEVENEIETEDEVEIEVEDEVETEVEDEIEIEVENEVETESEDESEDESETSNSDKNKETENNSDDNAESSKKQD